jgi:hypothetical protein
MFNISDYLSRFKNITPPDKFVKDELVAVVKDVIGVEIKKDNIDVRNGTIFLSVDPIIKNEIFLKKAEVLESLREKLKIYKKTVRDLH